MRGGARAGVGLGPGAKTDLRITDLLVIELKEYFVSEFLEISKSVPEIYLEKKIWQEIHFLAVSLSKDQICNSPC